MVGWTQFWVAYKLIEVVGVSGFRRAGGAGLRCETVAQLHGFAFCLRRRTNSQGKRNTLCYVFPCIFHIVLLLSSCFSRCLTAFWIVLLLPDCATPFQLSYCSPSVLSLYLYALQIAKFPKSSWTEELGETTQASMETFIESVHANTSGRTYLLTLFGPSSASPGDDDSWFAADFVMAHHIYGDIGGEQTWLSSVDLVKEAKAGLYL